MYLSDYRLYLQRLSDFLAPLDRCFFFLFNHFLSDLKHKDFHDDRSQWLQGLKRMSKQNIKIMNIQCFQT